MIETGFLKREGGTIAYTDYGGSGQPVVMLPGMGALRSEYRFLAPALRDAGYRPLAADLRGHGESSVPWPAYDVQSVGEDVLATVSHLDAGAAHLVGTSFSASAVVWAAAEQPDSVRSVVLISPFVRDAKINPVMKALFWAMMHNPWRVHMWRAYYGTLYPSRKPADFEEYLDRLTENMSEPGRMHAAEALANSSRRPSADRLEMVRAPGLVIMGTKDPDFPDPATEGRAVAGAMGADLEMVEGAGHYPQTEMPEVTAPLVVGFLERVVSR